MSTGTQQAAKKGFQVPHTYVIIFTFIIIMALGSYVIPPGVYDREKDERTGRTLVNAESYHSVERTPVTLFKLFTSVPRGMTAQADIIFCIFICCGAFSVLNETGAINSGVHQFVKSVRGGKEKLIIPLIMLLFAAMGTTLGIAEECIAFVPIGVAIARAIGYDEIVGVALISTGAAIGFSGGLMNTFTVGTAQTIAELPLFSGIQFRVIGFVFLYISAVVYTMRYANMVKRDPSKSYMLGAEQEGGLSPKNLDESDAAMTGRHIAVLLVALASIVFIAYGIIYKGFYIVELSGVFLALAIIGGLAGKLSPSRIARAFVGGCRDIAFGALVCGIARGIMITMQDGQIIDSIIHSLSSVIQKFPTGLSAMAMFWVQSIINFFIPSGSGQAATTMPIMAPLAEMIGITRQTAVMAFHYGDGFSNSIIPTSGALMGVLAAAGVPYERWIKFIWPLMVMWTIIGSAMCFIAAIIKLGPF